MLTQWVVMVLNCNVICHIQQCKCPDQNLWAPLYLVISALVALGAADNKLLMKVV